MWEATKQAVNDVIFVAFGILFLCSVACSIPLALFLMFYAN